MKRLKLLLGMAALACAIGLTVKYGSLGLENGAQWPEIKLTTDKNVGGG